MDKEEFGKVRPYFISGNYPGIRTLERETERERDRDRQGERDLYGTVQNTARLSAACSKLCSHYSFLMCIPEMLA
jgi:hypothetical protein